MCWTVGEGGAFFRVKEELSAGRTMFCDEFMLGISISTLNRFEQHCSGKPDGQRCSVDPDGKQKNSFLQMLVTHNYNYKWHLYKFKWSKYITKHASVAGGSAFHDLLALSDQGEHWTP